MKQSDKYRFAQNGDGINTRVGAQLLVENNVWVGT
jgi:hypothetical protein